MAEDYRLSIIYVTSDLKKGNNPFFICAVCVELENKDKVFMGDFVNNIFCR